MREGFRTDRWDALILTAANEQQANLYREAIERRKGLDMLCDIKHTAVVPDPAGRRAGSAGGTAFALAEAVRLFQYDTRRGLHPKPPCQPAGNAPEEQFASVLQQRRVLIIHAGGDSRRLPAYAPLGKIFMPVPGRNDSVEPLTLFDRQLEVYLNFPAPPCNESGQFVFASGDVLLLCDASSVELYGDGLTGLACYAAPEQAAEHGVFVAERDGGVRKYLQKPAIPHQYEFDAVDEFGRSLIDSGVMSFDHSFAARLLTIAGFSLACDGTVLFTYPDSANPAAEALHSFGWDFYREVACALGDGATWQHYLSQVRRAGSNLPEAVLKALFESLHPFPFQVRAALDGRFLHFGTTQRLIESGGSLLGNSHETAKPVITNSLAEGIVCGTNAWIEGCSIKANLSLGGSNLLVGAEITRPTTLKAGIAVDVLPARREPGRRHARDVDGLQHDSPPPPPCRFIRIYGVGDTFRGSLAEGGITFLNRELNDWLRAMHAGEGDLWDDNIPRPERSMWNAKMFPLAEQGEDLHDWLWMQQPDLATDQQRAKWKSARRFSIEEMAVLVDHRALIEMRRRLLADRLKSTLPSAFSLSSMLSASDIATWIADTNQPGEMVSLMLRRALDAKQFDGQTSNTGKPGIRGVDSQLRMFESARILHSLGTALQRFTQLTETASLSSATHPSAAAIDDGSESAGAELKLSSGKDTFARVAVEGGFAAKEGPAVKENTAAGIAAQSDVHSTGDLALSSIDWTTQDAFTTLNAQRLKSTAFALLSEAIGGEFGGICLKVRADDEPVENPRMVLRNDEIVWARSPARLDLAGGWTDTPPYTLERGGRVVNAAVALNGQQPIHAYFRSIRERVIRISSIDLGSRIEVASFEQLLDYRNPSSDFALVKAAVALSGFTPENRRRGHQTLRQMLDDAGGGFEIITLCAIPKGSGLGTSSILGATVLAAIGAAFARKPAGRELFEMVLALEQMLTTGGGWQDQVGGVLPGTKLITTEPGLHPDPIAYYLPSDLLSPALNNATTLLYYTGITRMAKGILQHVVGRYLDRERSALRTLSRIAALADEMRDALSVKDAEAFGKFIADAWNLNKQLDPGSTTPEVEAIIAAIQPYIYGAKLLGAGGGGFLLIVCKSPEAAVKVRKTLTEQSVNPNSRFFDFNVDQRGLEVTVS